MGNVLNSKAISWIVVSDLDGTLLGHDDYAFAEALPAIDQLRALDIPVIFNTSKTWQETLDIQQQLAIEAPFIVENGACLYLPKSQFEAPGDSIARGSHWQLVLGMSVADIRQSLTTLNVPGEYMQRLSQMSPETVREVTGLSLTQAEQAMQREFSEPFLWKGPAAAFDELIHELKQHPLTLVQGGRFYHLTGHSNKADAITRLRDFYPSLTGCIVLGDSANDAPMLLQAEIPVVVRAPGNASLLKYCDPPFITEAVAPAGWAEGISHALQQTDTIKMPKEPD